MTEMTWKKVEWMVCYCGQFVSVFALFGGELVRSELPDVCVCVCVSVSECVCVCVCECE